MRLSVVKLLSLAVVCIFSLAAQTVESEMSADRPGFRNSTHLVGAGVVQLENGLRLSNDHVLALEPEIRIGAFEWLELRLNASQVVLRAPAEMGLAGTSDLQVGVKFPIFNRIEGTRVVAIVKSTVPSGHGSQTTGGYEPGIELIWDHKLTDSFGLAGTWNLSRLKEDEVVWQRAASVSANSHLSTKLHTFGEVFVVSPNQLRAGNEWAVDAGMTRAFGQHLIVDAAAGHSVHGPNDWFVTVGFSTRTRAPHLIGHRGH